MQLALHSSPLQHGQRSTGRLMLLVIAACVPGVLIATWFFGFGVLINILLAAVMAVTLEAALLRLRNRDLGLHLGDNSALVTAVLFGIAVPPGSPWEYTVSPGSAHTSSSR